MPKLRRFLSAILAVWLCVMLVAFTYTWVSRNLTPVIKGEDMNIASAGALVISLVGDNVPIEEPVSLNGVVGLEIKNSFTFRQVSSQNGVNFFWKDFSPQLTNKENPAEFIRVGGDGDAHKKDYIEARFCLQLDDSLNEETQSKYVFIHPDSEIVYAGDCGRELNKAIRISLTFEDANGLDQTVILADLGDGEGINGIMRDELYQAVANLPSDKFPENQAGALAYQTIYDLHYFDCGRESFDYQNKFSDANYSNFTRDENRALFKLGPGDTKWVTIRIWLEGQDGNCEPEIAGEKFDLLLKFDSVFVVDQEQ